ncbi:hypothetical protein N9121_01305 [Pseudomonadales bacterium]|nr:hypothetical protein [Pseudomonadales bacterium]
MFKDEHILLDDTEKLEAFILKAKAAGKPLLVYDMAGKQVRWFQYFLELNQVDDYYFRKGGYRGFFKKS